MKKLVKAGLILFCTSLMVSCSNLQPDTNETNSTSTSTVTATQGMSYLGDINKIYSSSNSARYVTGQIIDNFYGYTVKFEGNLVEYNSIKQEILDYVEGLTQNNALMHQNYENVEFDTTKKYIEFSSYMDTTSEKIVCFEIRVFFGNFLETFKTDGWYAKSVMFNASFTKDIDNGISVDFGEPLGEEEEEDYTSSSSDPVISQNSEDLINNELINLIGEPASIYSAPNTQARYCTGQILNWHGEKVRFQGNLVAYSSVKQSVLSIFDNIPFNAMNHQGYSNVSYDRTKTYIEVCFYENMETENIVSYELRLIDASYFTGSSNGWYAKSYEFNSLNDIQ